MADELGDQAFALILRDSSYDEAMDIFNACNSRLRKAQALRSCAEKLAAFVQRKETLATMDEISAYVQELPLYHQRMTNLNELANRMKNENQAV